VAGLPRLEGYLLRHAPMPRPLSTHPGWLEVLRRGLGHTPYLLEAVEGEATRGFLPLAHVQSLLFGRFLVSLPYLNYGGVVADDGGAARALLDEAVALADRLGVRYLELRHEQAVAHPDLVPGATRKVHMRLDLPADPGQLWERLPSNMRNRARKGRKCGLTVAWGGVELLDAFYAVFSRNMRDLGTPVYGRGLFRAALEQFPGRAELCVVRSGPRPVAAALLLHGWQVSEVPSSSSLREYNTTCANMLLYWHLLERAAQRGQRVFDFGRSTPESNTYAFKKQWGAVPHPAAWQYHLRRGTDTAVRPDNPRYRYMIRVWQRLPLFLTRLIGPAVVRGIP
jgi:FemAB-related protein (PEP-CTERM system-associated)